MVISSRTPEGDPNLCPVCGKDSRMEPSTVPIRDAPCPHCGHLLWFAGDASAPAKKRSRRSTCEGFIMAAGKDRLGPFPPQFIVRLQKCIGALWLKRQIPTGPDLLLLVSAASDWADVLNQLEFRAGRGQRSWAYSAGAFVRKLFTRKPLAKQS